jgi:hypothetical protein
LTSAAAGNVALSASTLVRVGILTDWREFEHRVTIRLGGKVLDRRIHLRLEVSSRRWSDTDILLEDRASLPRGISRIR